MDERSVAVPYLPMIDACVPLAKGDSLAFDPVELERLGCRVLVADDPGAPRQGDYLDRIAALRNRLKDEVAAPFWLSLDADTRVTPEALREAAWFLSTNREWAGVGLWPYPGPIDATAHVGAACALHRTAATRGFRYGRQLDGRPTCECAVFTYSLRRAGWTYQYHPTLRVAHGRSFG